MKNFDVVFLHPPAGFTHKLGYIFSYFERPYFKKKQISHYPIMPMGLFSLASLLDEEGFETGIINLGLEKCLNPSFNIKKCIKSINATVFAIDLQWAVHSNDSVKVAKLCKMYHPNKLVVLGGSTATWFNEEIIKNHPSVDVIVKGESEETMLELVRTNRNKRDFSDIKGITYRKEGFLKSNPIRKPPSDLNAHNFVRPDLLDKWEKYLRVNAMRYNEQAPPTFWLPVARGCSYECIHCGGSCSAYRLISGREKPIFRSPKRIAEDIEKLSGYGVEIIHFSHDLQIGDEKYYSETLKEIQKRKIDISAYIETFQPPNQSFIKKCSKAFNSLLITVSPESASESVRKFVGKPFSDAQFFRAIDILDELEIKTLVYFCMGLPKESFETFELFKKMVKKIIEETKHVSVCPPFPYMIDPNCLMALNPEKYEIKLIFKTFEDYKNMSSTYDWLKVIGHETNNLTRPEIYKFMMMAHEYTMKVLRLN